MAADYELKNEKSGIDNPAYFTIDNEKDTTNQTQTNGHVPVQPKERAKWGGQWEFVMCCISMSVGLGNIWRFPFTAYENGGGAFLIPYVIILTVIGRPLYYLEMSLGQFSSRGNVKFYQSLSPYLKGAGFAQMFASFCVGTYYCSLMAISLFYFVNSFTSELPWSQCDSKYEAYLNETDKKCIPATATGEEAAPGDTTISSSELFFRREVLKEKEVIFDGLGNPDWRLTIGLFVTWALTFIITARGTKSTGKAAYFLAIFPYVIMITLLIRAATLEGADEGMYYFIKTDWNKLLEADVWYAAVTQCFFSLNVGFGSIMMFASFNDFNHDINRDALIVTVLDTLTSLLSGVTIFGILGNLAFNLGVTPDKVIDSGGAGLAFISYPDAIAKMDAVPWLFAILFFFMLFVLGVGSLVGIHNVANTVLQDIAPNVPLWVISLGVGIVGFSLGIVYVTPGGQFMLNLVDYYGGTFIVYIFIILEITGVSWVYGLENFTLDLEFMTKRKVNIYWRLTWGLITPILLIIIFIYFLSQYKTITYGGHEYPGGALAVGYCILALATLQFVYWILLHIYKHRHLGWPSAIKKTFRHDDWGPSGQQRSEEWKKFKEDALAKKQDLNRPIWRKWLDILFKTH